MKGKYDIKKWISFELNKIILTRKEEGEIDLDLENLGVIGVSGAGKTYTKVKQATENLDTFLVPIYAIYDDDDKPGSIFQDPIISILKKALRGFVNCLIFSPNTQLVYFIQFLFFHV
jgi:hypothetical protein